jgi:hypothetical protein
MALVFIFSILYFNKVESRGIYQVRSDFFHMKKQKIFLFIFKNMEGIPASQLHYLRIGNSRMKKENQDEDDQEGYEHVKRKSDFLLSLYGLPYTLVTKREAD